MLNENTLKNAVEDSATWEQAVVDFILCSTQLGQPFTSGHITTILRVYRPDLRFSHRQIGEKCQDLFHAGEFMFGEDYALQVPRVCAGLGRTPAGTTVFVYAASTYEAENFPFELDIPKPGSGLTRMPQEHPISTTPIQPNVGFGPDLQATVHSDKRLCVPRSALEALVHATGKPLRGGDPVWVRFDPMTDSVFVTLDQAQGAVNYDISSTRGRVLFPKPGSGQFNHGDVYQGDIINDALVINLSTTV